MKHLQGAAAALAALSLSAGMAGLALAADEEADAGMSPGPIGVFSIEGMDWLLTAQVVDGEMTPIPDGVTATLLLEDGRASGNGGCNRFFTDYTIDGFDISFGMIGSTLMGCQGPGGDVETAYLANLGAVARYQSGGIQMALLDADGEFLLEFDLAPPGSIVGDWVAQSINNGADAVVSSLLMPMVTASFTEDGQLSGSDGCNQYSTTYTTDGESITIDEMMASTLMACPDEELDAQAQQYLAALAAATTWSVDVSGALELRDDEGALQVRYTPAEG